MQKENNLNTILNPSYNCQRTMHIHYIPHIVFRLAIFRKIQVLHKF